MSGLNELLRCRVSLTQPRDRIISPEILHRTLSNLFDTQNPDFSYANDYTSLVIAQQENIQNKLLTQNLKIYRADLSNNSRTFLTAAFFVACCDYIYYPSMVQASCYIQKPPTDPTAQMFNFQWICVDHISMHKRKNDLIPYTCSRCQPNVNAAPDKSKENTEPLSREFYKISQPTTM